MLEKFVTKFSANAHKRRELDDGSYLFHQGDSVRSVFIVQEGLIELTRYQSDGASIVLQRAANGSVLAEASVYSEHYHCDAIVALPSIVLEFTQEDFLKYVESKEFSRSWAAYLASETQAARYRSEILSRNTVTERLDGWLAWHGNQLPSKGQWKSLARQIGVSPEALYREIARRRRG